MIEGRWSCHLCHLGPEIACKVDWYLWTAGPMVCGGRVLDVNNPLPQKGQWSMCQSLADLQDVYST